MAAGTYKLKLSVSVWGAVLDDVVVHDGETTVLRLGRIGVQNLHRSVAVCTPDSDCYNQASEGYAGLLTPEEPVLEVFPGTYKLKFGEQYEEGLVVEPGADLILE